MRYLAVTLCVVGTLSAAVNDTQKTTLVLRDHRYRAAAFTAFHELKINKNSCDDTNVNKNKYVNYSDKQAPKPKPGCNFGSKVQLTGFYNETLDGSELGEVFGANCTNCIKVGTQAEVDAGTADVENHLLLHYMGDQLGDNTLKGTISFNPKRTTYGTHVEVYVGLDKILKGLYFKENIVAMRVKNDLGIKYCNETKGASEFESFTLKNVLGGERLRRLIEDANPVTSNGDTDEYNYQEPLFYAKLPCESLSRTGLSNIESILGWRFVNKEKYYAGVNVAWHTPSGDRPTAEYLWEPRLGSKHWALGGGFEAGWTFWDNHKQNLKVLLDFNYRYQFSATEKRTLGIRGVLTNTKRCKHILSHYYLLGRANHFPMFPAANVMTLDVDVEPGSYIDGLLALNYNRGNWIIDAGYNLFWKEEESVTLDRCKWEDNTYAIAKRTFQSFTGTKPFLITDPTPDQIDSVPAGRAINYCDVDTCVAQTPDMLSHQVFGSIGYKTDFLDCPFLVALGGAYEFGDDRASADSFTLWGKLGLAF